MDATEIVASRVRRDCLCIAVSIPNLSAHQKARRVGDATGFHFPINRIPDPAKRIPDTGRLRYQSNRTVRLIIRGAIVPAARPLPDATYLPVFALLFTELFVPVKLYVAFMLVNCTSLNTLNACSCSFTPLFLRPMNVTGNRRDSVTSHSCQVGWRRIPTGVLPKLPTLPFG